MRRIWSPLKSGGGTATAWRTRRSDDHEWVFANGDLVQSADLGVGRGLGLMLAIVGGVTVARLQGLALDGAASYNLHLRRPEMAMLIVALSGVVPLGSVFKPSIRVSRLPASNADLAIKFRSKQSLYLSRLDVTYPLARTD
jgi:hypothetical protein